MATKIPTYDHSTFYPLGARVRRIAAGFNAQDVLGTVVGYDFFGAARVEWDAQETFL